MERESTDGVSPVLGIILMTAVTVALVSFGTIQVLDIAESTSKPVEASYNLDEKESGAIVKVVSSENAEKFQVYRDSSLVYETEKQTFTKKIDRGGTITVKAVNNGTGNEQLLLTEEVSSSIGNSVVLPNGKLIDGGGKEVADFSVSAEILGFSQFDYVGDSGRDLAFVNSGGDLVIRSDSGDKKTLVESSDSADPRVTKATISGGEWKGSESIFYVGSDKKIYRVDSSGSPSLVANPSSDANAISDIMDIDNDNKNEFVFADGSQQLKYIEQDGSVTDLGVTVGVTVGSNNGIGVSTSSGDFDGNGVSRIATVDGSNDIILVGEAETDITISQADAKKAPIATVNIDSDNVPEVIYTDSSSGNLKYIDNATSSQDISNFLDEDGNTISGDGESGIISS